MDICPGKGVLIRGSFQIPGNPCTGGSGGSSLNLERQPDWEGKNKWNPQITCLKATPSRKVPQTPASATSKWGRNGEERAALLRVRTGPECPEDNRREFLWVTNLNCGIAREREIINQPEHTAGRSQNKGSEQVQRRAHRLRTGPAPLEAGGRGRGKGRLGPKDRIPYRTANKPPVSKQRLPEILDGQHLPGGSWGDTGRMHPTGAVGTEAGTAEGRRRARTRETVPIKLLAAWAARTGKAQKAGAAFCSALLWNTRGLEPRAAQGLNSLDRESSAGPSPQRKGTSNLKKSPLPPACVRAEIRHWRDGKQSQINKGNRFRRDRCNRLKSL